MLLDDEKRIRQHDLSLREVTREEVSAALSLSTQAGWNQREFDWRLFLEHGKVIGLFTDNQQLVATAAVLPYEPNFAWISMVIVDEGWRRRGLATLLLRECLRALKTEGRVPALDATEAGSKVYRNLGFLPHKRISRLYSSRPESSNKELADAQAIRVAALDSERIETVLSWDAPRFGGNRSFLISKLAKAFPDTAWIAEDLDRQCSLEGYILGRDGRQARQLGPLCATDDQVAIQLFNRAVSETRGPAYIDVPQQQTAFIAFLRDSGWRVEREFLRMSIAPDGGFSQFENVYAIGGPELG